MCCHDKKLELAICGLGSFAIKRIIPAIAMCSNIELVAVIDSLGKECDLPFHIRRFQSLEHYFESKPAGAVYIATPNYLHAKHSIQCLLKGLHVLCEKPMATSSQDCQSMIRAAQDQKLYLKVGHMLRYSPALQLARRWLQDGLIGKPFTASVYFHYDLEKSVRPWAFHQEFSGGGALMDAGVHCIDAIRFLLGDPVVAISAITDRVVNVKSVERSASCHFTVGGVATFIQVCSQAPYWTRLSTSGERGDIVIDNFAACWGMSTVKIHANQFDQSINVIKEETVDVSIVYSDQLREFADTINKSQFTSRESIDAAKNVEIVEKLYEISQSR